MRVRAFSRFERMLARRYLLSRRREGFVSLIAVLSFLGISLGVATLIAVMSVMNGFERELLDKILGVNGHFVVYPSRVEGGYEKVLDQLAELDGVEGVIPYLEGQVLASTNAAARGVMVRGVRGEDHEQLSFVNESLVEGVWDKGEGAIIGTRLSAALRVGVGDKLTLVTPRGTRTPFGVSPRSRSYEVVGIFEVGMAQIDGNLVFLPLEKAHNFLLGGSKIGGVNVIEGFTQDPLIAPAVAEQVRGKVPANWRVKSWQESNATISGALRVERNVMFFILMLIVLVAALNVVSGMVMLVKEKNREVAILRAMGVAPGSVMRIFFMAGATIGVVGTAVGFALGVLLCANIEDLQAMLSRITGEEIFPAEVYLLTQLPAEIDAGQVTLVVGIALVLSLAATLYPSWRAAKVAPVEALRYE